MQKGFVRSIKIIIVLAIIGAFVWFLVLSPMITFRNNEKTLEDAAREYFEINSDKLPTGERVKTLSLSTLYKQSYLKEDFKVPYSDKLCSIENSWVKVRKGANGEYDYISYLDCGILKSNIDHTGPVIKLSGGEEIQISVGEEFKDPGVSSVMDDNDGKIDTKEVTIKGSVDTSKVGEYELTYTAFDSLSNKTVVTRKVKVVKIFKNLVKNDLGKETNYKGNPTTNYVRLSNMYFRIFGVDSNDNIILVSEEDVSNVNFSKLEKWLDEVYMEHFTEEAKKLLVQTKFCNMKVGDDNLDTTKCTSYTSKRYVYIPSIDDINKAESNGLNFMKPYTMSWTANSKDSKNTYLTRNVFYGDEYGKSYLPYNIDEIYGVRPKLVVKGDTLVTGGDGTKNNPYTFGETKKAKGGDLLNTRYSGEYIKSDGYLFRIIEVDENDGTTKVISDDTLGNLKDRPLTDSNSGEATVKYDIKDKNSYAYYINNQASNYIDVSLFVAKEIEAPVYKNKIIYGEESKVNKFKVKVSPPDMFDMFSAQVNRIKHTSHSYWLINSSNSKDRVGSVILDIGVPINDTIPHYAEFGVRVVGYVKKGAVISTGSGTYDDPYNLK